MIGPLVLALLVNVVYSQPTVACSTLSNKYASSNASGAFGCCGIGVKGEFVWTAPAGMKCTFRIPTFAIYYADNYLRLVSPKGKVVNAWNKGSAPNGNYSGTDLKVQFSAKNTDSCTTKFWIEYKCEQEVAHPINNNVDYIVTNKTTGGSGFVYLTLDPSVTSLGRTLRVTASTVSYQGLKAPGFYIANGYLPSLEESDFTNTTVKNGNAYTFDYIINKPDIGTSWVFAMFSYGKFAQINFKATWLYDIPDFVNDDTQTAVVTPTKYWIRQIYLNKTASNLLFEYSREEPGGHTTFLVGTGFVPTSDKYTVKKSTQEASFGEIAFPRPPTDGNNPGLFIVKAITSDPNAGFLFRSTWRK